MSDDVQASEGVDSAFQAPSAEQHALGAVVRRFQTKVVRNKGADVGAGLHWAGARRGLIVFRERGLQCGNWVVPYETVTHAHIVWFASMLGRAPVLVLRTSDAVFQFGMNPDRFWRAPQLPLPIEVTTAVHGRLRAVVTRTVLGIAALLLLWSMFRYISSLTF